MLGGKKRFVNRIARGINLPAPISNTIDALSLSLSLSFSSGSFMILRLSAPVSAILSALFLRGGISQIEIGHRRVEKIFSLSDPHARERELAGARSTYSSFSLGRLMRESHYYAGINVGEGSDRARCNCARCNALFQPRSLKNEYPLIDTCDY